MDKPGLLHRLKGLRASEAAGQALRLARTLTGKKNGCAQLGRFRTFDPVDMQGLVHRSLCRQGRSRGFGLVGGLAGAEKFLRANFAVRNASSGLQPRPCIRIVVVVNGGAHLWINQVYATRSGVYGSHKPVG